MTSPAEPKVTLREFIEQKIENMNVAINLHTEQYSKRIDTMEHCLLQIKDTLQKVNDILQTCVTKHTFDGFVDEYESQYQLMRDAITKNEASMATLEIFLNCLREHFEDSSKFKELFTKIELEFINLKEKVINNANKNEILEKWQTQQEAYVHEREKTMNWRLTLISIALVIVGLLMRYFHV